MTTPISKSSLTKQEKARDYALRRIYGISIEQYNTLLRKQRHRCKVCKRHESEFRIKLSVDHDHKTGEIRGLLCTYCNRYVIGRHRDPTLLASAARYLKGPHTGWTVPPKKFKRKKKK